MVKTCQITEVTELMQYQIIKTTVFQQQCYIISITYQQYINPNVIYLVKAECDRAKRSKSQKFCSIQ